MSDPVKKIAKKVLSKAKTFTPSPGLNVTSKTATSVPASRGKLTGYSKEFKKKHTNATNALFVGALGLGAAASGGFSGNDKPKKTPPKTVSKSDTLTVKKMGGLIKSKSKK